MQVWLAPISGQPATPATRAPLFPHACIPPHTITPHTTHRAAPLLPTLCQALSPTAPARRPVVPPPRQHRVVLLGLRRHARLAPPSLRQAAGVHNHIFLYRTADAPGQPRGQGPSGLPHRPLCCSCLSRTGGAAPATQTFRVPSVPMPLACRECAMAIGTTTSTPMCTIITCNGCG